MFFFIFSLMLLLIVWEAKEKLETCGRLSIHFSCGLTQEKEKAQMKQNEKQNEEMHLMKFSWMVCGTQNGLQFIIPFDR